MRKEKRIKERNRKWLLLSQEWSIDSEKCPKTYKAAEFVLNHIPEEIIERLIESRVCLIAFNYATQHGQCKSFCKSSKTRTSYLPQAVIFLNPLLELLSVPYITEIIAHELAHAIIDLYYPDLVSKGIKEIEKQAHSMVIEWGFDVIPERSPEELEREVRSKRSKMEKYGLVTIPDYGVISMKKEGSIPK